MMSTPSADAAAIEDHQARMLATTADLDLVRQIVASNHPEADPVEVFARAVQLSRHDAVHARHQGMYARSITGTLLKDLGGVFAHAGPIVVFLLQPIPDIPTWSRYALGVFLLIGATTYIYTSWTNRPRIPRVPGGNSSGWLAVVAIPKQERTAERLVEHYVLRALSPITSYAAETGDHGDVAHPRHRRNQYSNLGSTLLVLTGTLSVALLLLRL